LVIEAGRNQIEAKVPRNLERQRLACPGGKCDIQSRHRFTCNPIAIAAFITSLAESA
jgi:hypothetical protein